MRIHLGLGISGGSSPAPVTPAVILTFADNSQFPANPNDVASWNVLFDTEGASKFTSVEITGSVVYLRGAEYGIGVISDAFDWDPACNLVSIEDQLGCITYVSQDAFGADVKSGCPLLESVILPECLYVYSYAFKDAVRLGIGTVDLKKLNTISGSQAFANCNNFTKVEFPVLAQLGNTAGGDGVFAGITGHNTYPTDYIDLWIPESFKTNNGGICDGDIQTLLDNNGAFIYWNGVEFD